MGWGGECGAVVRGEKRRVVLFEAGGALEGHLEGWSDREVSPFPPPLHHSPRGDDELVGWPASRQAAGHPTVDGLWPTDGLAIAWSCQGGDVSGEPRGVFGSTSPRSCNRDPFCPLARAMGQLPLPYPEQKNDPNTLAEFTQLLFSSDDDDPHKACKSSGGERPRTTRLSDGHVVSQVNWVLARTRMPTTRDIGGASSYIYSLLYQVVVQPEAAGDGDNPYLFPSFFRRHLSLLTFLHTHRSNTCKKWCRCPPGITAGQETHRSFSPSGAQELSITARSRPPLH